MDYILPLVAALSVFSLCVSIYAIARVGRFINATQELSWDVIASITGDLATVKKSIQTLNGRLNGMHSPKLVEETLLAQINQTPAPQKRHLGG
jgi:hypothetical protein